ncbi:MAG: 4-hydroxy-tetrahydrodipicolinate reductase [Flavobacterium sp.]|jgi:4-hydroxy-tetrahydrodipicolinate reductase|uniref:4-hydroxy-tetrahydrodipicolinate reductase n=1 Tax=Flavobacterium sp. TaxID=239 RepID=UPI0022BBD4E4|nr:4-hydroxy-tetrahydrodipicolinate reductase [Flavobacterium sp.]MCZ8167710.1 4-hydroxy-tetrahydrodipicolinate reductase [Flavobacterium sp.]MCZ8295773.1 4-hydroxy-tetrahydrodipicolinate reductase [Flavobacterium sp.]
MNIALLGYGKMGKVIERIALERGHAIVLRKTRQNSFEGLETADVAIDFSIPDAAVENITACLQNGIPVVSGTTGWLAQYEAMKALCEKQNGAFLYGSNFSLGVNLFFELNQKLAQLMAKFPQYAVDMEEIHHTQKLDKPSGTAITLAEGLLPYTPFTQWSLEDEATDKLYIDVKRENDVPGTHSIFYRSAVDTIEIKHTAHNREGFAYGAVIAAEWLATRKGVFTMKDVLDL